MVFAIAPADVVFSGFASGTLWLVLGGLIIAEAVNSTGLGVRFARFLIGRHALSYRALIAAVVLVCSLLCIVMPATVSRILLLLPIMAALAQRLGLEPGSVGYDGVALAVIMTNYQVGTAFLPANAPNLVLAGAAETLYGIDVHLRRVAARAVSGDGRAEGARHHRARSGGCSRTRRGAAEDERGAHADERRRRGD